MSTASASDGKTRASMRVASSGRSTAGTRAATHAAATVSPSVETVVCAATSTPYTRADSLPALEQALAMPNGGIEVVEAVVGRADRRALDGRIRALGGEPAA